MFRWFQIELARDMGYTAARFGHVMFPENVYEPALECAELLLQGVGKGWASRAYFSDNGSTAIEIALKMAFRKFSFDHDVLVDFLGKDTTEKCVELKHLKDHIMVILWVPWKLKHHHLTQGFCSNHGTLEEAFFWTLLQFSCTTANGFFPYLNCCIPKL
ncbi:hypothetical protein CISIN_1g031493mg [Citrus sinensis]|uniref:Uncharacterized protein n=1 Tax=Citrus sinensis TaxID=2711 RepID=A0A067DDB7_CITSI|nr:hypothetical protein CISIN_1g031493mg [Citrus sinensis]